MNKIARYGALSSSHIFFQWQLRLLAPGTSSRHETASSIAVEMFGLINESASHFLAVFAKKISQRSGDERETTFVFQRISVLLQRYNSIVLHDSFIREDCSE